jgi:hypothetical protein
METGKTFCLGLSRTGTTSLHAAAVILGLASVHYPLRLAMRWMAADFSEAAIGPFSFYTDLPVPVYFREFDRTCKGARFILPTRDPDSWIESVERYFTDSAPNSAETLNRDLVRLVGYGMLRFHRQHFLDVYHRHTEEVLEYFRDRPADLLILDTVKEPNPWEPLCRFLGCPVPDRTFPHLRSPAIGDLTRVTPGEMPEKQPRMFALVYGAPAGGK